MTSKRARFRSEMGRISPRREEVTILPAAVLVLARGLGGPGLAAEAFPA